MDQIRLENNKIVLLVNLNGGAYSDFHLKELPINPINWQHNDPEQPPFKGHFLCFDRWGPPSIAEKINGYQHHGEVNTEIWKLVTNSQSKRHNQQCGMMCYLPMAGLQLTRKVELSDDEPVFFVEEKIENLNEHGRMFNIVQHVTLAPPFLDSSVLFDNNTKKGFENKEDGSLYQEEPILKWPETIHEGKKISLRQFKDEWPRVSSFVYDKSEKYAWATASNPNQELLLGYIWKTEEYPWINYWRDAENGISKAFGMEFGTTGLHEPFPIVARKGKIFDRNIYDYIDAGEVITKSFTAFLAKVPGDYKGVEEVIIDESTFTIKEAKEKSRNITYNLKLKQ